MKIEWLYEKVAANGTRAELIFTMGKIPFRVVIIRKSVADETDYDVRVEEKDKSSGWSEILSDIYRSKGDLLDTARNWVESIVEVVLRIVDN